MCILDWALLLALGRLPIYPVLLDSRAPGKGLPDWHDYPLCPAMIHGHNQGISRRAVVDVREDIAPGLYLSRRCLGRDSAACRNPSSRSHRNWFPDACYRSTAVRACSQAWIGCSSQFKTKAYSQIEVRCTSRVLPDRSLAIATIGIAAVLVPVLVGIVISSI